MRSARGFAILAGGLTLLGCDRNAGLRVTITSQDELSMVASLKVSVSHLLGFDEVTVSPNRKFIAGDQVSIGLYLGPDLQGSGVIHATAYNDEKPTPSEIAAGSVRFDASPGMTTELGMCISSRDRFCHYLDTEDGGIQIGGDL